MRLDAVALPLGVETAIPLGLIVNELIANAYKHAFPDGRTGSVDLALRRADDGAVTLVLRDDGVGLPPAFDAATSRSLGMQLVTSLTAQIEGRIAFEPGDNGGTCITLSFTPPAGATAV